MDSNWWVLKPDFRLPTEDEMRAMVSPEQCCAFYSMIAAEQRLKDAGYGEKSLFAAEDDNDEDTQNKIEDEVKAAPWSTTRAFISAMNGKCILNLPAGVADPAGCSEGFSYVRIPNKPMISKEETQRELAKEKKTVTGTDADLRRLPLNQAKQLLRKHGVAEEDIKKLSRWEVIDVVRTLSTEQAKAGSDTMSKFARGNRFSIAEHQERYKEDCQRIFDLQNKVLNSKEVLSTDEESEEEEDSEIDEYGKNIENIIQNKNTSQELSHEKEEQERKELQKLFMGEDSNQGDDMVKKKRKDGEDGEESSSGRILKIYRTFTNKDGKEYVRIETVRKSAIIDTYVRIRQTKDPEFINKFANALDDQQKEEKRREKRRLQEQLRRLKRNEEKEKFGFGSSKKRDHGEGSSRAFLDFDEAPSRDTDDFPSKYGFDGISESLRLKKRKKALKEKRKKLKEITMKCGSCGQVGHMKTNRNCPNFEGGDEYTPAKMSDLDMESEDVDKMTALDEGQSLIKVDDTKIVLSKALLAHTEEQRRKALVLKVPKELMKRKRRIGSDHCDYLQKPDYKSANRQRTDPLVSLSLIFENTCLEMKEMQGSELFWTPVNAKQVPDYYKIINKPMDIQSIRKKVRDKEYSCREAFLNDVNQMVENSILYNGINSVLTETAKKMYELAVVKFTEKEEKMLRLEKAINPLLDDNDQVAFSFLLDTIASRIRQVPESWPFYKPVDRKKIKNYYDLIKNPMDLETLQALVKHNKYTTVEHFLSDIELVYSNSLTYNGPESVYTKKALEILQEAKTAVAEHQEQLTELETKIDQTRQDPLDAADSESVITASSFVDRDELSRPGSSAAQSLHGQDDYEEDSTLMDFEDSRESSTSRQRSHHERHSSDGDHQPSTIGFRDIPPEGPTFPAEKDENVDENYDPEEFLFAGFNRQGQSQEIQEDSQEQGHASNDETEDTAVLVRPSYLAPPSEDAQHSQEEMTHEEYQQQSSQDQEMPPPSARNEDDDDGGLWF